MVAAAELKRSRVLVSEVRGRLDVVPRAAAAVEGDEVVAVLIVLSIHLGQPSGVFDTTKIVVSNRELVGIIACNARRSSHIDAEVQ